MPSEITVNDYAKNIGALLQNPGIENDPYRAFVAKLRQDPKYKDHIDAKTLVKLFQDEFKFTRDDKSPYKISDLDTWKPTGQQPSAGADGGGYWDALRRGYHAGSEALDTAYANVAGLGATALEALPHIPGDPRVTRENDPLRKGESYLRGLAQREGARAQAIPESRGIGPSIAEAIPTAAGSLVPAMIGAEAGGVPGMATAAGVEDIDKGKDWQERAKSAAGAAGRTAIYGRAVGQTEKLLGKVAGKLLGETAGPTVARWGTPVLQGAVEAGRSLHYGASPEKALAQGITTGGLAMTQTSRGESKAAKPSETVAPKGEAPPAVREEPPVREIPKEDLQGVYESEIQKYQDLRPRNERAQAGLKEARAILKQHQDEVEALELSPTPPDTATLKEMQAKIEKQKSHLKALDGRASEIGNEYRQSRSRLMEIRDRAVAEKAKWFMPEPPAARREPSEPKQIGPGQAVARQASGGAVQAPPTAVPAPTPRAQPPYQQPGQPQVRVGAGQEPPQLPASTQPFEMMGEQPPLPRGRRIEAGEPAAARPAEQVSAPAERRVGTASAEKPAASAQPASKKEATAKPRPVAKKTAAPPKSRKEEAVTPAQRTLAAGTRYVVKDTNPDLGLYKGETIIYRGPYGGKYGFDVIDPETGTKSLMQIDAATPMADIVGNLEEEGQKKKRPGDKHLGDSPQPVKAKPEEQPSILGEIKNKVGELLGPKVSQEEATGQKVPQGEGDYSVAYSRTTHRPIIMAHSQEQMNELAGGDYGATFLKPGDVGVGGGPLAQVVRKSLTEGPVSVVGPDVTAPMEPSAPGKMQGTVQHEVIHQVLGETKVSSDKFLDALPSEIAEPMRAHLTKNFPKAKWGEEIPAHLGASGVNAAGSDPRINQAETIGLSPEQAQKAWKVYLSLLAKQDPKKAAKLKAHMAADTDTAPPASRK